MKQLLSMFTVLFAVIILSGSSIAQEWSAEQQDVWKGVQAYWEAGMADDPSTMLTYWDDTYNGWSYNNEAPGSKADAVKYFNYWNKKGKIQYYIIKPAKIWVNGNLAYVHYYYTQVMENSEGKPSTERGRWTDILMKKDGKWILVGDHGGEIKDK
ncbi:MAG: YybH family protein [Ignavibacteria bacterium]